MASDGQIVFEITADGKHAIADIKAVTKAIKEETGKWDDAASKSSSNIENSFTGMLKKLAAGFSAVKIGKALLDLGKDAVQAASDLEEVQNVVDVTFGENANKIETWAKNAGTQFGLTETQAKKFTSTMGAMLKSSGMAGEKIVDVSTDLAGLAADMASFYNLDFDEAFSKIRSGISGQTMPLKELGIDMSVATLNAFALKQGLTKTFEQMSQSEQTMLRYQYLMQATADAQGDFSRTSDGYANSVRKLQTNVEALKTTLGTAFIGVVSDAVSALNGFLESLLPDESKRTVLDDFRDIDLKTEEKLEGIRKTAEEARLLTDELDKIGGSKADKAGAKVQKMATDLSNIKLDEGKAGAVKDFLSVLSENIDVIAGIQDTDADGAKAWLEGIADAASKLDEGDVAGWDKLLSDIKEGLPGIENTDFGAAFFSALGSGFSTVGEKSSVLQWAVESLGNKTNKTAQEQALWLETCKRLVSTIPGLSSIINTETGEIKGGTEAVKEYIKAWEEGQTKLAMLGALKQKESAVATRFAQLPELQLDAALAEKRVRDQANKIRELYKKYGIREDLLPVGTKLKTTEGEYRFMPIEQMREINGAVMVYEELIDAADSANAQYKEQAEALEEAKIALEEYRATINEMPGEVEAATDATTQFYEENAENIKTLVNAANDALKELDDYVKGVKDGVSSAIDSTTSGFAYIGSAAERQSKRLKPLESEMKSLQEEGKELGDIQVRISDATDMYGIGNLTKNLQSQLEFLKEYKADMEKAREMGFSDDFLAQFADGSVESAEWLHEIANAAGDAESGQVKELNDLWASVSQGKQELTDTLTQQKLSIDQTYDALVEKAKQAVANLDLAGDASTSAGNTIQGIADGIRSHVSEVAGAVDEILAQLMRLNGYGINLDFGGFGEITFSTAAGKNAEGSHRMGLDLVPHDDYLARLHEGERVLTAQENQIWNSLLNGGISGFDLESLGGVMRDNIKPGGNVYLDGKVVGAVVSDRQGRSYKSLQRSGWQS